jgi:hypothetical protein
MYLDEIADRIRSHVPEESLPRDNVEALFRLYAVLLRAKGPEVTQSDVHDVWSAWTSGRARDHESLVPYEDLPNDVQEEDRVFVEAIRRVCTELSQTQPSHPQFQEILFPSGPPASDAANLQTLELYKIMVQSSEALVNRRQTVNTFFLTMNGAILTALGLIVQSSGNERILGGLGVLVLALTGALLCAAWRSLIISFGQLNRGKFKVINTIERYFTVSIYAAEWEALGRGEDPNIYRSFTSREIWVPTTLFVLYVIAAVSATWLTATKLT